MRLIFPIITDRPHNHPVRVSSSLPKVFLSHLVSSDLKSSLHLHEQPLLASNLSKHIVIMDEVVERRQPEANPAEIFHQGLGVGGTVDGHDKAVAAEVLQFAELEQGH
jgi:hypothetical protein